MNAWARALPERRRLSSQLSFESLAAAWLERDAERSRSACQRHCPDRRGDPQKVILEHRGFPSGPQVACPNPYATKDTTGPPESHRRPRSSCATFRTIPTAGQDHPRRSGRRRPVRPRCRSGPPVAPAVDAPSCAQPRATRGPQATGPALPRRRCGSGPHHETARGMEAVSAIEGNSADGVIPRPAVRRARPMAGGVALARSPRDSRLR